MISQTDIPGVVVLRPPRLQDGRGWFSEIYNRTRMHDYGFPDFVQENESLSNLVGTIRGLHFQRSPFAQAKLVRCVQGAIFSVAVDLRQSSKSFGQHVAVEISASGGEQMFIPIGFAHGLCTLTASTLIHYKVSAHHSPAHESGVQWRDEALKINWPQCADPSTLSNRDRAHPSWTSI